MNENHLFNRKNLKSLRACLRNKSASAEAVLWNLLKSRNLKGRKFRRQHSIDKYIVDFYCPSERLIIELDGNPHGDYFKIEKDIIRDKYFEALGLKVLRFENRIVFQDPGYLLNEIFIVFQEEE